MAQSQTVMRILAASVLVANRAGNIIRDIMSKGELGIIEKSKNDLQTEADRSAQRCIIASLAKQFPNIKIIGEEGQSDLTNIPSDWLVTDQDSEFLNNSCPHKYENLADDQFVIWVDPLDGTAEYTQGFVEHVTVLIGVSVNQEAVGGVIHQPYYKRNGQEFGRTIWGLKVVRVGGAGYKVLQLLEGKAHAYVFASRGCKKWDTCAPEAVLEAHGGVLTDVLGNHYTYGPNVVHPNKFGVIATAKTVSHKNVIDLIPENVKAALT